MIRYIILYRNDHAYVANEDDWNNRTTDGIEAVEFSEPPLRVRLMPNHVGMYRIWDDLMPEERSMVLEVLGSVE